jgi:hypothetical protein
LPYGPEVIAYFSNPSLDPRWAEMCQKWVRLEQG